MEIKSYFENIREVIIDELQKAKSSIFVAVAWFTDNQLYEILCEKAQKGVKVEVIAIKDEINTTSNIDFNVLFDNGGKVWLIDDLKTMHNKFCVVDDKIVITGSYNWTINASNNHENIMLVSDHFETIEKYIVQFKQLKNKYFGTEKQAYKQLSLRLSTLLNMIHLNDISDIEMQLEKIKKFSLFITKEQYLKLNTAFNYLLAGKQDNSIELIEELIRDTNNHLTEEEIALNTYDTITDAALHGSLIGIKIFFFDIAGFKLREERIA